MAVNEENLKIVSTNHRFCTTDQQTQHEQYMCLWLPEYCITGQFSGGVIFVACLARIQPFVTLNVGLTTHTGFDIVSTLWASNAVNNLDLTTTGRSYNLYGHVVMEYCSNS